MAETVGTLAADLEFRTKMTELQKDMVRVQSIINRAAQDIKSKVNTNITSSWDKATSSVNNFNKGVWNVYTSLKDIWRVATGILMSQLIYRGILQPIQNAWSELWNFNQELEKTHISLRYFLEDAKNVNEFVYAMQDLAATTPYVFTELADTAKMFFRYGFTEQQVLPMVKLIADMGAATGTSADQINHLAMAFGQVMAKGRLVSEEAKRQIGQILPINQILKDELGITVEQLGDVYVSAQEGLTAIFNWVRKKYPDAAYYMEQTTQGLLSSIKDYALFIAQDLTSGMFDNIKAFLKNIRDTLAEARQALREGGLQGLLTSLFPENIALNLYQLISIIHGIVQSFNQMWQVLAPVRQELLNISIILAKFAASGFAVFVRTLQAVITSATQAAPVLRTLIGVISGLVIAWTASQAITMLVGSFAALVRFVTGALTPSLLMAIKVISIFVGLLGGILIAIPRVREWIGNLGNTFARVFGIQIPASIAVTKAAMSGAGTYDLDFSNIEEGFEDVGQSAEEAGSKIKDTFLASFDEIYQIPDKLSASGATGIGDLGEIEIPELGDMGNFGAGLEEATIKANDFSFSLKNLKDIMKEVFEHGGNVVKGFFGAIWDTLQLIVPKIILTLTSAFPNVVATISRLIYAIIETIIILMPNVIQTISLLISTMLNAFKTYGYENFAGIAIVLAGMFAKMAYHLGMIAYSSAEMIASSFMVPLKYYLFQGIANLGIALVENIAKMFLNIISTIPMTRLAKPIADKWSSEVSAWALNQTKLVVTAVDDQILAEQDKTIEQMSKNIELQTGGLIQTFADMMGMLGEEVQIFTDKTKPIWVQFGNDLITLWDGTGTQLLGTWDKFFTDTQTSWSDWWTNSGKPLWEGTGADIQTIWSAWMTMTKDEFAIFWKDIQDIHQQEGSKLPGEVHQYYDDMRGQVNDTMSQLPGEVHQYYDEIRSDVGTEMKNMTKEVSTEMTKIKQEVIDKLDQTQAPAVAEVKDVQEGIVEEFKKSEFPIKTSIGTWKQMILDQKTFIVNSAKEVANAATSAMNLIFKNFHPTVGINIKVPDIEIPDVEIGGKLKGFTIEAPHAAAGAVVYKNQLVNVGEGGKPEMIAPLSESALAPFANMIAGLIVGNRTEEASSEYVAVKMKRSDLVNLERDLFKIRKAETLRVAGRTT